MSFSDHFSIANIPYGIGTSHGRSERAVVTRLHDKVFFLDELELQCSEDVRATFQQVGSSLIEEPPTFHELLVDMLDNS